jgi:hypothetical protein
MNPACLSPAPSETKNCEERIFHHIKAPSRICYSVSNDKIRTKSILSNRPATHVHICGAYHANCEECMMEIKKIQNGVGPSIKKMIDKECECDGFMRSAPIDIPKRDINYRRTRYSHSIYSFSKDQEGFDKKFELDEKNSIGKDTFDNDYPFQDVNTDNNPESISPGSKPAYAPVFVDDSDEDKADCEANGDALEDSILVLDSEFDRNSFLSYDFENDNDRELFFEMDL